MRLACPRCMRDSESTDSENEVNPATAHSVVSARSKSGTDMEQKKNRRVHAIDVCADVEVTLVISVACDHCVQSAWYQRSISAVSEAEWLNFYALPCVFMVDVTRKRVRRGATSTTCLWIPTSITWETRR